MRTLITMLLVNTLYIFAASAAFGVDLRTGNSIEYPKGQDLSQDILAAGDKIDIRSAVAGDVTAAGQSVNVSGSVKNSAVLAGRTVDVTGRIGNDAWMAGERVTLAGPVTDTVYIAGNDVVFDKGASSGSDLMAAGNTVSVNGRVGKNLRIAGSEVDISGIINGSVYARGERIRLLDGAVIRGDLNYESTRKASISPGARIIGKVRHTLPPREKAKPLFWSAFTFWIGTLLAGIIFGIAFLLLFPSASATAADTVQSRFLPAFGIGLLILIVTPIVCMLLALTLIGIPLAVAVLLVYIVLLMAAGIVVALALGRWLLGLMQRRNVNPIFAIMLGVFALKLIELIPFLGELLRFIAIVTGLGAILMTWWRDRERRIEPQATTET